MISYLPQNPAMLVSAVNMLLRDGEFDSLEDLCSYYEREPHELKEYLQQNGYIYNEEQKQFK